MFLWPCGKMVAMVILDSGCLLSAAGILKVWMIRQDLLYKTWPVNHMCRQTCCCLQNLLSAVNTCEYFYLFLQFSIWTQNRLCKYLLHCVAEYNVLGLFWSYLYSDQYQTSIVILFSHYINLIVYLNNSTALSFNSSSHRTQTYFPCHVKLL